MIKHLTFTDHRMTDSAVKCKHSATKYGCDSSTIFMPTDISNRFAIENVDILSQDRGAGYWLWKPYFILNALNEAAEGDIIVYTDAGIEFVADVNNLINEMPGDIMVFANGWRHGDWCKMDVMQAMKSTSFADHQQAQASCVILRVSEVSIRFVAEWLEWCCKDGFITDEPSTLPNEPTFKEHRHDQAILTNLALSYGIPFNRWCAQYNLKGQEQFNNNYGIVFNHHGRRNNGSRT